MHMYVFVYVTKYLQSSNSFGSLLAMYVYCLFEELQKHKHILTSVVLVTGDSFSLVLV